MRIVDILFYLIIFSIIGFFAFVFFISAIIPPLSFQIGPCDGFEKVDEIDYKIETEEQAIEAAINYYNKIGYSFNRSYFDARIEDYYYLVMANNYFYTKDTLDTFDFCSGSANPPECIGVMLHLVGNDAGGTDIEMRYTIPC